MLLWGITAAGEIGGRIGNRGVQNGVFRTPTAKPDPHTLHSEAASLACLGRAGGWGRGRGTQGLVPGIWGVPPLVAPHPGIGAPTSSQQTQSTFTKYVEKSPCRGDPSCDKWQGTSLVLYRNSGLGEISTQIRRREEEKRLFQPGSADLRLEGRWGTVGTAAPLPRVTLRGILLSHAPPIQQHPSLAAPGAAAPGSREWAGRREGNCLIDPPRIPLEHYLNF